MLRPVATAVLAVALLSSCAEQPDSSSQPIGAGPTPCLPHQQLCASGCVDVGTSVQDCGQCGVACAPGAVCQAGACMDVCGVGLGFCGAQCVSLASTTDCGRCGNACLPEQFCVGGACSACSQACAPSDICVAGQCVLNCGALTACNGACVDLMTDAASCGVCGSACTAGKTCVQGSCTCPAGLESCGDACVDTAITAEHCGGCDQACGAGGLCEGGQCVGPDGCTDTPVSGLALSAVDVYQSVQIPIMEEGAAVASGARNADVVAGRKTLFRVHVAPEAGFMSREVSARIELTEVDAPSPDQVEIFFASLTPTRASTDDDLTSTFQVMLPPEAIGPSTRYAVTLVECDGAATAPADMSMSARFPSTGYQALEARETGPLKVHVIPVGTPGPDVSDETLQVFKERLEAVFPITEAIFTVGPALTSTATSMCSLLGTISARRSQDGAATEVYYYGLTNGTLGGQSGCSNATPSASSSKVSCGWAQGFASETAEGAATMCHELGHAHGRLHAPCNVQDPDPGFPYSNAEIGVWGYDFRSDTLLPPTRKDMMSYCPEPRWDAWVSDYNYQAILERVVAVTALPELPALAERRAASPVAWRLLVSDSAGVHFIEEPMLVRGTPEGTPVNAVIHDAHGATSQKVTVYKQELHDGTSHEAFMLTLPEPDASWRAIEVPGLLAPYALPAMRAH